MVELLKEKDSGAACKIATCQDRLQNSSLQKKSALKPHIISVYAGVSIWVSQIILMVPAADLRRLHVLPLQPQCTHLRRQASDGDRKRVHDAALMVHHAGAQTNLLPFPRHQVRGTSPPNLCALDLEEQCNGFRPVVVAAEVEPDDDREPRQLVIA